jgi:hypothetical protein
MRWGGRFISDAAVGTAFIRNGKNKAGNPVAVLVAAVHEDAAAK